MSECRVFLRSAVTSTELLAALQVLRPFTALDGPMCHVEMLGVRSNLLVELVAHGADDWGGVPVANLPRLVRFIGVSEQADVPPGTAWTAAHAFLWILTRRHEVEDALLVGPGVEALRYSEGRIRPISLPQFRYSGD